MILFEGDGETKRKYTGLVCLGKIDSLNQKKGNKVLWKFLKNVRRGKVEKKKTVGKVKSKKAEIQGLTPLNI